MSRHPRSRPFALLTAAVLGLATALLTATGPASAGQAAAAGGGVTPPGPDQLAPMLAAVAQDTGHSASPHTLAPNAAPQESDVPSGDPGSLLTTSDGSYVVQVRVSKIDKDTRQALKDAGAKFRGKDEHGTLRTITARVKANKLEAVANAAGVQYVGEVLTPLTNAADPQCGPVVSEGDAQLNADDARATYGVDGTGVKVGILSDSYDRWAGAVTHAAGDVAAGELPGTAYPCAQGPHTPVDVLDDTSSNPNNLDEGRAMSQVVHDLAPGADLGFHTAFIDDLNFAQGIIDLKDAGAKVIADDVTYYNEPFFQEGPIANAVTTVNAAGTIEFSSAANSNLIDGSGHNFASLEAPAFRPTTCPSTWSSGHWDQCMDFDPGAGTDTTADYTVAAGGTLTVDMQWAQPWYGVTTDLDMAMVRADNGLVVAQSVTKNVTGSKQPFEFMSWKNTSGSARTVHVEIGRWVGPPNGGDTGTPRVKIVLIGSRNITSAEYATGSSGDVVGPTIFGHNGGKNAVSVAAVPFNDSSTVETYSSRGPVTHYFAPVNGTTPAAALGSPDVLAKPDLAATDCAQTTFFLPPGPPYRFCGTSEAAPHAAAVAALMLDADSTKTPAQLLAVLQSTAVPVGGFGTDAVGAGLIDASAAVGAVNPVPLCNGLPATITGSGLINGTSGNDVIVGSAGTDIINAGGGNDTICAGDGADQISDGPGDDTVLAGDGDDAMLQDLSANGADDLRGEGGNDTIAYNGRSSAVNVTLAGGADDGAPGEGDNVQSTENVYGGSGNDTITGSSAANFLDGLDGDDVIDGAGGADVIVGTTGNDQEYGGPGDDTFAMDDLIDGQDVIDGGGGSDLVDYGGRTLSVVVNLSSGFGGQPGEGDGLVSVERVNGGSAADALTGDGADNVLSGGPGADTLTGGLGADILNGEGGNDHLFATDGVHGNDTANGGAGSGDFATADSGDTVTGVP